MTLKNFLLFFILATFSSLNWAQNNKEATTAEDLAAIEAIINEFIQAVNNKDVEAAYKLTRFYTIKDGKNQIIASNEQTKQKFIEMFNEDLKDVTEMINNTISIELNKNAKQGYVGFTENFIFLKNRNSEKFNLELEKENNSWKISYFLK